MKESATSLISFKTSAKLERIATCDFHGYCRMGLEHNGMRREGVVSFWAQGMQRRRMVEFRCGDIG